MSGLDLPSVPAARSASRLRLAAAGCALLAAVGGMVGSFLDLFTGELKIDGETQLSLSVTSWGFDVEGGDPFGAVPTSGYPLVFAAVLLFGAASMSALAASAAATPGTTRGAAVVTVAGTAFLAGVVWAVGMELASFAGSFRPVGITTDGVTVEQSLGPGLWFLLVAVALAIAAAVLALLRPRRRTVPVGYQVSPYQADMSTPRHGFPIPVALPGQAPPPVAQQRPHAPFTPPPMAPIADATAPPPSTMSYPNPRPVTPPPPGYPRPAPPVPPTTPSPPSQPADPSPAAEPSPTTQPAPPAEPTAAPGSGAPAGPEQAGAADRQ
ncbi:MAG: hypothetical protein GEV28_26340 [Actinophytocola sp.]|uniref:hypothetical protein n=1 Tax=Actinophytocola sp. TaxID=1872138 RepID=UPI00132CA9B3|nr:hypothetical protein [Actinophytocola sp.]MPZ83719.1 hypothetical protein [Actinophytocola sp.]